MKNKLLIALAVTALSLTTGLGSHFGIDANGASNPSNNTISNTSTAKNLRSTTSNVSYEFDVLNMHAWAGKPVKIGVKVVDNATHFSKSYGNFQLKDNVSIVNKFKPEAKEHADGDYVPSNLNAQQIVKIDNLPSEGATVTVFDVNTYTNSSTNLYNGISFNVSAKNATAYDTVNKAYYMGIVTAGHPKKHEWFSYNANTSDIAQTLNVFNDETSKGTFDGLFKIWTYADSVVNGHTQNPASQNWKADHFNNKNHRLSTDNMLTFQTPVSFKMLRTDGVQYDQAAIRLQLSRYYFISAMHTMWNIDYNLDQGATNNGMDVPANDELNSVHQVVDLTTLAGATKTVNFFNGRAFFLYCHFGCSMKIEGLETTTVSVEFNAK